jgi:hypothetical protein
MIAMATIVLESSGFFVRIVRLKAKFALFEKFIEIFFHVLIFDGDARILRVDKLNFVKVVEFVESKKSR